MKFTPCIIILVTIWQFTFHVDAVVTSKSKAEAVETLNEMKESGSELLKEPGALDNVLETVDAIKNCDANMCFALDGSRSISLSDYNLQKQFVNIIAAIVAADEGAGFAATQYGLSNVAISPLTMISNDFLEAVSRSQSVRAPATFIGAGLAFCTSQMNRNEIADEPHKIVILGDGKSNFGDLSEDGFFSPAKIAERWRDLAPAENVVCAVTVGVSDPTEFEKITGDPELVLGVAQWEKILDIMRDLVKQVCDTKTPF